MPVSVLWKIKIKSKLSVTSIRKIAFLKIAILIIFIHLKTFVYLFDFLFRFLFIYFINKYSVQIMKS